MNPTEEKVQLTIEDCVARLRLNRPEVRNAFDADVVAQIGEALEACKRHSQLRVLVLEGNGPVFCAGADIAWMRAQGQQTLQENEKDARRLSQLLLDLDSLEIPVIVRVQGAAMGGGLGLVATGDIVIATRDSRFALPEVRIGILPALIAPFVFAKLGASRCRDLFLSGRSFTGTQAEAWGLVTRIADEDDLDHEVTRAINEILAGGPKATRDAKLVVRGVAERPAAHLQICLDRLAAARASAEGQEGLTAFLEKRKPSWWTSTGDREGGDA